MIEMNEFKNKVVGFFDGKSEKNNVSTLIRFHSENTPEKTALIWPVNQNEIKWTNEIEKEIKIKSINYKDFYSLALRTATGLKNSGIGYGDNVMIFLPMSLALYETMASVMMLGAKVVFLDSWARKDQLGIACEIVKPKAMISFEKAFIYLNGLTEIENIPLKVVCFNHSNTYLYSLDELEKNNELTQIQEVQSSDTALITFTTGSSGRPKGADRTHEFLSSQHQALKLTIPYKSDDLDLPAFPIFSLNNLAEGVSTVIPITDIGTPTPFDPVMLISQMISQNVTCATLSPSMVSGIADFCKKHNIKIENIRRVVTGGAPISNEVLSLLKESMPNAEILVLYGSTEVEPIAHIEANDILKADKNKKRPEGVKVGKIVEALEYKLIKINKNPVSLENKTWNEIETGNKGPGELIVSGLHVCKSYYNDPEAVIRAKIIDKNGKIWHRTGDVSCLDENNNIWLIGRVHNVIVRNDQYLFPIGTEILLKSHPSVDKAAYIGIACENLVEKAYVVISLKKDSNKENIFNEIKNLLDKNKVIYDQIEIVDEIPMDPRHHSKVEYEMLRKKLMENL